MVGKDVLRQHTVLKTGVGIRVGQQGNLSGFHMENANTPLYLSTSKATTTSNSATQYSVFHCRNSKTYL